MDIDTMPAGSEVDALIGQHVFGHEVLGWVLCTPDMELQYCFYVPYDGPDPHGVLRPVYLAHCVCDLPKEALELGDADYWGHTAGCLEVEPEWSVLIGPAWQVIEAFRRGAAGHVAACVTIHISDIGGCEDSSCIIFSPDIPTTEAWAPKVPLAICRAALEAVT